MIAPPSSLKTCGPIVSTCSQELQIQRGTRLPITCSAKAGRTRLSLSGPLCETRVDQSAAGLLWLGYHRASSGVLRRHLRSGLDGRSTTAHRTMRRVDRAGEHRDEHAGATGEYGDGGWPATAISLPRISGS